MREMKDSGVEWIGEIPKDWGIIQIKKLLAARDGGSWGEEPQEDQLDRICYRVADFDFSRLAIVSDAEFTIRNYTQPIIDKLSLERGDILVEKSGGGDKTPVGRAVFFDKDEPALFANFIERLRVSSETSPRYFFYVWISLYLTGVTNNYIKQTTGIQNLDIKSLVSSVFVPSFDYKLQHRIADYLDAKCAQLDRAIARQQEVIEKLKEYKLSVITEAVTKGLNPDVPMKDSGIDICSLVPNTWNILKIKHLFSLRVERNYESLEHVNLLSLYTDLGVFPHGEQEERGNKAVTADGYKIVAKNDIVVNIILAWMGAIGISDHDGVTSPAYDIYMPLKGTISKYYHYLFRTKAFSAECYKNGRGIMEMRWRTYSAEFMNIFVPVPPEEDQINIADYLDKKCSDIDAAISRKENAASKLTEYKKSLIYEVVTGKREV